MPKVKPLTSRPEWEINLLREIGAAQAMTGESYKQICQRAGLVYDTFMSHMQNPYMMRHGESNTFIETCNKLIGG